MTCKFVLQKPVSLYRHQYFILKNEKEKQHKIKKLEYTVKPVLSDHLKIDKTKVLKTNGNLMKVESIAECSPWSILQYV